VTNLTDRISEIRYACRRLVATPGTAIAGIAILALTIGLGTALYCRCRPCFGSRSSIC
jgi:hypothetical protein